MANSRKRPAESAAVSEPVATAPNSKKRKVNTQKYYAVRAGRRPGIYLTWEECQQQIHGFRGASYKSFTTREDAEAYVAGQPVSGTVEDPDKWYAVAVGNPTGIFRDWTVAQDSIKGVKGPKYKKFKTRAEAVAFIKDHGDEAAIKALGETGEPGDKLGKRPKTTSIAASSSAAASAATSTGDGVLNIYTDGSSLANGKVGARAGIGVYFGVDDPRNVSEPLDGDLQTNQRAELMAMARALTIAPVTQTVRIFSDSKYSINCVTAWASGWEKKEWKTAHGQEVKNQDLIKAVRATLAKREKAGGQTYFQWVRGHASDPGNIAADHLAVRGANMG